MEDDEEEQSDLQQVMQCLDTLELQVGMIDSNMGELTTMAQHMNANVNLINHNLMVKLKTYFHLHTLRIIQDTTNEEERTCVLER